MEDNHLEEGSHLGEDIHHRCVAEDTGPVLLGNIVALTSFYPVLATISFS